MRKQLLLVGKQPKLFRPDDAPSDPDVDGQQDAELKRPRE
jgi:hypothetical protein